MGGSSQYEPAGTVVWKLGKTAASIRFVNEAENFMASGNASEDDKQMLREAANAVRSGERVLTSWVTIETFLVSGFPG